MNFHIKHQTEYTYSAPVFLEPHIIRLQPRSDSNQKLLDFNMVIEPSPSGISSYLDIEGNSVSRVWFNGLTDKLLVRTEFTVETRLSNPFDFILEDYAITLPMNYPDDILPSIKAYQNRQDFKSSPDADDTVKMFAICIAEETGWKTMHFLSTLNCRINEKFKKIIRKQGNPNPPSVTLYNQCGSCRDLAVLFIECCKTMGIASRFASGYQAYEKDKDEHFLHAWAEVYLPGGGWRGFDPSAGLAVSDNYITVAAATKFSEATPVDGNFRASGVSSTLNATIIIDTENLSNHTHQSSSQSTF